MPSIQFSATELMALVFTRDLARQLEGTPIPDAGTGSSEHVARVPGVIEECQVTRRPVYVDCYGGHGRTGMIVGCYLTRQGLGGQDALDRVRLLHRETLKLPYPSPETSGRGKPGYFRVLNRTTTGYSGIPSRLTKPAVPSLFRPKVYSQSGLSVLTGIVSTRQSLS